MLWLYLHQRKTDFTNTEEDVRVARIFLIFFLHRFMGKQQQGTKLTTGIN